jgi:hypothetical protein
LMMEPVGCPETSARNCHYTLCNTPEERRSYLLRCGSLKSRNRINLTCEWGRHFFSRLFQATPRSSTENYWPLWRPQISNGSSQIVEFVEARTEQTQRRFAETYKMQTPNVYKQCTK